MSNEWILDVIADLRAFASKNGLESLADHLHETSMVAALELTSRESQEVPAGDMSLPGGPTTDAGCLGALYRPTEGRDVP